MKLRDMMFLVIGGLLVISGMVLNSCQNPVVATANALSGEKDAVFGTITCRKIFIKDGDTRRGGFGLNTNGNVMLQIYGDGETSVVYLGENMKDPNGEMLFRIKSRSNTDNRMAGMSIDKNGGRFDSYNKIGKGVVGIAVGGDSDGHLYTTDKGVVKVLE